MRLSEAKPNELDKGRFASVTEVSQYYGITGASTVRTWVRKYGKNHLLTRVMRVEMPEERDQIKELNQRIRKLEKALAETKVDEVFARAQFEVACKELGVQDLEAYKKKLNEQLSNMD